MFQMQVLSLRTLVSVMCHFMCSIMCSTLVFEALVNNVMRSVYHHMQNINHL